MNRPALLSRLPDRLAVWAWARLYQRRHADWHALYESAPLKYAPGVRMTLVPGDLLSGSIAFTGVYEIMLSRRVAELGRKGGTMVDIGANLGYFSLLWAAQHPQNRCFAFEPCPRVFELLRHNVQRNALETRIELLPLAAGASAGRRGFDPGPDHQTGWGGLAAHESAGSMEVNVVRVDERIGAESPVDLLKIDIEGADTWALMGCEGLLRRRLIREIWYEQNKPRMRALGIPLGEAEDYLRSVGYVPTALGDASGDLVAWRARPERRRGGRAAWRHASPGAS